MGGTRLRVGAALTAAAGFCAALFGSGWSLGAAGAESGSFVWAQGDASGFASDGFGLFGGAAASGGQQVVWVGVKEDTALGITWARSGGGPWSAVCGIGSAPACPQGPRVGPGLGTGPTGVILYGGQDGPIGSPATGYGDTWRFTGSGWELVCDTASCGPGARLLPAFAGNGSEVLMYGGLPGGPGADDTWRFDGTTWTKLCGSGMGACGPGGLLAASMAWDGTKFVMFGGGLGGSPVADTWTWSGSAWTKVCGSAMAACGPPGRSSAGFATVADAESPGVLMAGGAVFPGSGDPVGLRDAWFWDGATWGAVAVPWDPSSVTLGATTDTCGLTVPYALPNGAGVSLVGAWSEPGFTAWEIRVFEAGFDLTGDVVEAPCAALVTTTTTTTTVAPTTTTTVAATTTTAAATTTTVVSTTTTTAAAAPATLPATGPPDPSPRNLAPTGATLIALGLVAILAGAAVPGPAARRRYTSRR